MNRDFDGKDEVPIFLCVLNGAIMFTAAIMNRVHFNAELVSIKMSSYTGTQSTGTVLVPLGQLRRMSMPVLRRIAEFARAGVAITGPRPERIAGMEGDYDEFNALVEEVWGRSNVSDSGDVASALAKAGVCEDVKNMPDSTSFVHRKLAAGDIYWLANICSQPREMTVSLRESGRVPVLWNAVDCSMRPADYHVEDGRTVVTLPMERDDALFIVTVEKDRKGCNTVQKPVYDTFMALDGPWSVDFQENRGAPAHMTLDTLASFTELGSGLEYFSGKAVYHKSFELEPATGARFILDLDKVGNMAHVYLNGKDLGLLWKEPFCVDITDALASGSNELEIAVTNSWANRLIGDAQPGAKPVTYTSWKFYEGNEKPVPSGIWGPVRILVVDVKNWGKQAKVSDDTAGRDVKDLTEKGILVPVADFLW